TVQHFLILDEDKLRAERAEDWPERNLSERLDRNWGKNFVAVSQRQAGDFIDHFHRRAEFYKARAERRDELTIGANVLGDDAIGHLFGNSRQRGKDRRRRRDC